MRNYLISGVSKGLGLKIAETALENGFSVYGISRSKTEELEVLLKKYPDCFFWKSVDLSDKDLDVRKEIFKDFLMNKTHLDGFVNNAALAYDDIITNLNQERLESMYRANVFAPMMMTKYAIRNMIFNKVKGSIVHISSISVHTGYKGLAMYASTKGAIEAFSKNTAREWGETGIRSNALVAGFMETNMSSTLNDGQKNRIYNRTSLKRPTTIESVASTVLFLLGNQAESITGQNIFVDSGTI